MSEFKKMKGSRVPMVRRLREIANGFQELADAARAEAARREEELKHMEKVLAEKPGPLYSTSLEIMDDAC